MMRAMPLRGRRARRSPLMRLGRPLLSLGILTAGLLLAGAFVGIAVQGGAVEREADAARRQISELEQERAEREAEIARRQTDAYVIDRAREYGYVRAGEGIIAVERGEGAAPTLSVPSVNMDRLARWLALFFGEK